ncbi:C_GCAxxG_C_C family probable redox protein [Peptoclostridium litorale DSM 5388]|uniref:C_GCAxxG_C_C family protein n=1 Tax=Peptoclostridium litorale DSM 5388 TaxID=1121324 RepID=A0A069RI01_PEPLI|nr:C-GCAxxG-C-C family protein [Peptoclostridium litorale]KDR96438.1 C_GCAxxG_C_C family protein [Peptoclostridium litorale DSM 5388]SIN70584.1 C_GCAxxG_C_C family probable redox protein [Peptoclostridium litorale DSM 5388]
MDRVKEAMGIFNGGFNCCQAVVAAFAQELGLDRETALKISSGFGGGMRNAEICGAVSGAVMALGLKYGHFNEDDADSKEKIGERVKAFSSTFKEKHGSIICRELLGCDTSTEEGKEYAAENELREKVCNGLIECAVELLEDMLKK